MRQSREVERPDLAGLLRCERRADALTDPASLIVTALLGRDSFDALDSLRRQHFPAALNKVPAHISLFHHLPGASVDSIVETADAHCRGLGPFDLMPAGLRYLGRGVAIGYDGGPLIPLQAALATAWADWLTPQDRQRFKPHVTIQNKVAPEAARSLFDALQTRPFAACRIEGVAIWRYLGGPWAPVTTCSFAAQSRSQPNRSQYGETTE